MTAPYLAPSLAVLRAELNARWPHRDRASDGWIGDDRHQATKSDHNPNSRGSVNALDVDEDGVSFAVVFAAIKRHPSARYVIYERRLYHRLRDWRPEPYSGPNPHDHHFHLSIDQTARAEQDRRPWGLIEEDDDMPTPAEIAEAVWSYSDKPSDGKTRKMRDVVLNLFEATFLRRADSNVVQDLATVRTELAEQRRLLEGIAARLPEVT